MSKRKISKTVDAAFAQLIEDMRAAKLILAALPDDRDWTLPEFDELEDMRSEVIGLTMEINAIYLPIRL